MKAPYVKSGIPESVGDSIRHGGRRVRENRGTRASRPEHPKSEERSPSRIFVPRHRHAGPRRTAREAGARKDAGGRPAGDGLGRIVTF